MPVLRATAVRFVESSESAPLQERMAGGRLVARREQTIRAASRHELAALLKVEKRWRRIGQHSDIRKIIPCDGGPAFYVVKVHRLRDTPARWPWVLGGLVLGAGALAGLGVMVWQTRYIWLALAGIAATCALLIHLAGSGGSAGCRCPFCGLVMHK